MATSPPRSGADSPAAGAVPGPSHPMLGPLMLMVAGSALLALLLRTQALENVSFWFDEACSGKISQFPLSETLDAVSRDAHPPLYYLVLKCWMFAFGTGVVPARGLSIVCAVGSLLAGSWFLTVALGQENPESRDSPQRFESLMAAAAASVLIAVNPLQVELGQEARPYTLGVLLSLLAATFALKIARSPARKRNWIGLMLAAGCLTLTHYFGLFTVAALVLFLIIETIVSQRRRGWTSDTRKLGIGLVLFLCCLVVLWSPWMPVFLFQRSRSDGQLWMGPLTWSFVRDACWRALAGGKSSELWPDWAWLAVTFWVGIGSLSLCRGRAADRLVGLCAVVPLAAAIGYGVAVRNILGVRYLAFAEVFVLLAAVLLVTQGRSLPMRCVLAVAFVGWNGFWLSRHIENRESCASAPGVKGAMSFLNRERIADQPVIVSSPYVHTISWHYIADRSCFLTVSKGDHRLSILSGPALREQDYAGTSALLDRLPPVLWTVDVDGLFGGVFAVRAPAAYRLVSERRFSERFGHRMEIIVRKYEIKQVR